MREQVTKLRLAVKRVQQVSWLNWLAVAGAVLVLPFVYQALTEYIRMRNFSGFIEYTFLRLHAMLPGYIVLAAVSLLLVVATARPWISSLCMGLVLFAVGAANYFKLAYRGDPLMPKDFSQVAEAAMITREMNLSFSKEMWLYLLFIVVATVLLLPFRLPLKKQRKTTFLRVGVSVACCAFIPLFVFGYFGNKVVMETRHGVKMVVYSSAESYYRGTFISSFLYLMANNWQEKPPEYSQPVLQQLAAELPAPQAHNNPDIIVVLMESFYDLQTIEGTSYSEPLMPNYTRLMAEGVSGQLLGDKRDGGTSDIEYQVLTGFTTSFLPMGAVPMIEYVATDIPSLPKYLAANGYSTLAIHPYIRSYYNRPAAYPNMGIETFHSIEDFDEGLVVGNYISDDAFADKIIMEYEQRADGDAPVFIHAVSMQNHQPYTAESYPAGYRVEAYSGFGAEYDGLLSTYATGVRDADAMMGKLCDYFASTERDVLVLFFGDHQTGIGDDALTDMAMLTVAYQTASPADSWKMTHTTPYLIWANYRQQAIDGGLIAPYMLVPTASIYYDLTLPGWFNWLGQQRALSGGVSGGYYIQPDGTLLLEAADAQTEMYRQQLLFQYDLLFGKKYAYDALYEET